MNILFFLPSIKNRGGVERATVSLLNSFAANNSYQVFLMVFSFNKADNAFPIDANITIIDLGINNYKRQFFSLFKRIRHEISRHKISHFVTVETMGMLFTFLPIFTLYKRPKYIVWEHFNFKNNNGKILRSFLRRLAAQCADLIVTLTARDVITWKEHLHVKKAITYIYNISPFEEVNSSYNIASKKVISVGRYVPVKGFDRLIRIWSIVENKYKIEGWELSIVGYGELKADLQNLINTLKCTSVQLVDGSSNVMDHYKDAALYCMTSYYEGLPMVLIEAQSFGLPAISFDIYAGPSEIFAGGSGLLVKDNDLAAYAEGLYRLISSENIRKELSDKALRNREIFKGKKIANLWLENLQKL
ncbi:glycosyltransferase family 4 protein [Sphingobacterium rhinopitheci]|uniref:glycosyltransferase family 4 protein n=1 Tax=Sphingobacterium rhinopitheci TaxID=2781960 RepID=UPI001F51EB97|nr:glycosyltransferase family 4 protein [Sphingobacterium rhinopitheci]MCI0920630.1 glycosyltransferase family 4 protein [Sphingobacterium rhinopitheci]